MKDPVRLLSGGSADVQDLLRSAKADAPTRAQLDHLAAKLAPTIAVAPATSGLLPWLFAGAAVLGAAAVVMVARDRSEPQRQPAVTARIEAAPPVVEAPAPPVVETAPPIAEQPAPIAEPARVIPKKKRVTVASTPTAEPVETPVEVPIEVPVEEAPPVAAIEPPPTPREMDLLTPAHAALRANDAKHALALAERHASLYASGTFAEEREAIAIEALEKLGQRDRARTRLAAFTTRYPRSSYRARLERSVRE